MNIASDTRERIGTTSISESLHNTYNFSQESGKTVKAVRVETVKDGNKVCNASLDLDTNRLFISITDYKFLTKEERISVVGAMLNDIDEIITEEVQ